MVRRTVENTPDGRQLNAVDNFDSLRMGEGAVDAEVDAANRFQYVLVVLEDGSGCTWRRPSKVCKVQGIVEEFVRMCATFGSPTTRVSDNATHFRNRVVRKKAKTLDVEHRVSVANSAWTNGSVKRVMREVIQWA